MLILVSRHIFNNHFPIFPRCLYYHPPKQSLWARKKNRQCRCQFLGSIRKDPDPYRCHRIDEVCNLLLLSDFATSAYHHSQMDSDPINHLKHFFLIVDIAGINDTPRAEKRIKLFHSLIWTTNYTAISGFCKQRMCAPNLYKIVSSSILFFGLFCLETQLRSQFSSLQFIFGKTLVQCR